MIRKNKKWLIIFALVVVFIIIITLRLRPKIIVLPEKLQIPKEILVETTTITTPKEIFHGNISKKEVIFTFDGGSTNQSGDKILKVLAKHHVKGTFFLTGKMIENNPSFVKRIIEAGHEIFNHTYDHLNLIKLSDIKIGEELTKMDKVLQTTTGISSKPYFRAPYGSRNKRILDAAAKYGYQSVFWTVDALDWKKKGETVSMVKKGILSTLASGNIYLMHVGDTITGTILDDVFTTIESKGYKIVSLTQGIIK